MPDDPAHDNNEMRVEGRGSNEKEKLKNTGINSDDVFKGSVKNNTHERYYYFADERSDSGVSSHEDSLPKATLKWSDFNADFHSSTLPLKSIEEIC